MNATIRARLARVAALIALVTMLTAGGTSPATAAPTFTLTISSPSLIFHRGPGSIAIGSTAASVSWKIADIAGAAVGSGVRWMSAGASTVDISALSPGYYTLSLHAGAAPNATDLTVSFAVIEPVPTSLIDESSPFGAATHLNRPGWGVGVLDEAVKVGISHIREDAFWSNFETSPGTYTYPAGLTAIIDGARARGITPMVIANGANSHYDSGRTPSSPTGIAAFGAFAAALVDHYDLDVLEVLNEYNGGTFNTSACGRTAACYLDVLEGVAPAVKAVRPSTTVVGPATIGIGNCIRPDGTKCFAPDLIDRGGLDHLDAYSVHPYHYPGGPEWLGGSGDALAGLRTRLQAANAGSDVPIYLSEMGWPTQDGGGTTELQQADNLVRLYAVALANGVERIYWYDLVNDGRVPTSTEHNFGLLRQPLASTPETMTTVIAHAPKPAIVAQAVLARKIGGLSYAGGDPVALPVRSAVFGTGAATMRILWASAAGTATIAATGPITVTDVLGRAETLPPTGGRVLLPLTSSPVFVEGPVVGVS
ncbi:hypothetical protein [Agromyces sp. NPDC056965]|uniref:hypothetical protein n=1 Tax=Agromyces sp. NPDC056965 TaxID=3345983 RepID=UPI0036439ABA